MDGSEDYTESMMPLRKTIRFYLDDIETSIGRAINLTITALVLVSSSFFVAETYPIPPDLRQWLNDIDAGILVVFVAEYGLRLWCAEKPLRYCFSLYALIDLVAILPFFLGTNDIRFIRIFRWFRILRLIRFLEGQTTFGYVSSQDGAIVTRILFTLFAIVFVYSGLIYQVEHPVNPDHYRTFLDAVYFSVATMSTVGFGDVTPISEMGRLLTVLMIMTGIVLIPWQLGDLIKRLVKTTHQRELPCSRCELTIHDIDAKFCKTCGAELRR